MARSRSGADRRGAAREGGLTLVEVMVALAVLAIALAAVVQAVGESTGNVSRLRERTFATWIAENTLAEMQLARVWTTGTQEDTREFAGRDWPVTIEIQETQFPAVRRVDVRVMAPGEEEAVAGHIQGLLTDPGIAAP